MIDPRLNELESAHLGSLSVIEIDTNAKTIRLIDALNTDAAKPVQHEHYGPEWTLPMTEAISDFMTHGFWETWGNVNDSVCGGITLRDGLSDRDAIALFVETTDKTIKLDGTNPESFKALWTLPSGNYTLWLKNL